MTAAMIDVDELCREVAKHRGEAIVIACQTARRAWHRASSRPELDVHFRGVMGKGSSLALGLALAVPDRQVIVLDGDGSLLMNLGSLASIADAAPGNLCLIALENGVYAGTGGQKVPGAGTVSFAGFARAAGFRAVASFDRPEELRQAIEPLLRATGPAFATVKTAPVPGGEEVQDELPSMQRCLVALRGYLSRADRPLGDDRKL